MSIEYQDNIKEVVSGVFNQTQQLNIRGGVMTYKLILDIKSAFGLGDSKALPDGEEIELAVCCGKGITSSRHVV